MFDDIEYMEDDNPCNYLDSCEECHYYNENTKRCVIDEMEEEENKKKSCSQ